jgi:hypothetical protein|tara:strand:+ start:2160 stop:2432 length:273 start_codon:yes stop_codon:yes gene_type:complete
MFGNELSETTISKTCEVLKRDRESIENCNVSTLRFEVEELYDISHAYVFSSAISGDVIEGEIRYKKNVDELYSMLMNDIEAHLDTGGILI